MSHLPSTCISTHLCVLLGATLLAACGDDGPAQDSSEDTGTSGTGPSDGSSTAGDTGPTAGTDSTSDTGPGQDETSEDTDSPADFDPIEATIADVLDQVRDGPVLCETLVTRYQQLVEARDPQIGSLITWNEEALAVAEQLDAIPVDERGALHCVPVVVKDNIDVAGLPTTGGVQALAGSTPGQHAPIVARLRDAGAVILGKTNMPDFALDGINTLSSVGGQTLNPYDLRSTVYGSSGGTAAAIAASLGVVGLGTDTFGSLVHPGSAAGVVAIRPTQGLLPGDGILPLMSLQDMAGPMARNVADAAALLTLMAEGPGAQDYTLALRPEGLEGLRIGFDPVALQEIPMLGIIPDPQVGVMFDQSLTAMAEAGADTVQIDALFPLFGALQGSIDSSFGCMPVDFKQSFEAYLGTLGGGATVGSLAEVIQSGAFLPSVEGFITGADAQTETIDRSAVCQTYLGARAAVAAAITQQMDDEGLDLVVYPAANHPPFPAGDDPPEGWFGFQALSSTTALPSLTLPMGLAPRAGLPVGLIFLARANREDLLIQAAHALELYQSPRVPPPAP